MSRIDEITQDTACICGIGCALAGCDDGLGFCVLAGRQVGAKMENCGAV